MKIEVGEYVRTKDGIIDQVIIDYKGKCNNSNCNGKHVSCEINYYDEDDIIKHSKNIIDLIEVGDYVNGHLVKAVYLDGCTKYIKLDNAYENGEGIRTYSEDIKSILTKEQMASIEYKVEEDK